MSTTDVIEAWQCIGCGKLDSPQPCIGVCKDRKVRLVHAAVHEEALARLAAAEARVRELTHALEQLAHTRPRDGQWESSYRAFQRLAQTVVQHG